jgi:uncharacterized lipoprotein NlpE involved in copper resistance
MKRPSPLILTVIAVLAATGCVRPDAPNPDPAHVARNSLDWAGSYRGLLPCADCDGIETVVRLENDGTYRLQLKYRGRSDEVFTEQAASAGTMPATPSRSPGATPCRTSSPRIG